jgi:very-short-patch-repair endonuclease
MEEGLSPFTSGSEFIVKNYLEGLGFKHNVVGPSQTKMDFFHPELKINVEIDGDSYSSIRAMSEDCERDNLLWSYGILVIRVLDNGITPDVVEMALEANSTLLLQLQDGLHPVPKTPS